MAATCMERRFEYISAFVDAGRLLALDQAEDKVVGFAVLATNYVQANLTVIVSRGANNSDCQARHGLTEAIYSAVGPALDSLGHYCLNFAVVYHGDTARIGQDAIELVPSNVCLDVGSIHAQAHIQCPIPRAVDTPCSERMGQRAFGKVLFAGTFDHLHLGHKWVLTQALFQSTDTLFVAVASEALLMRKQCPAALEPYSRRVERVEQFLNSIRPPCWEEVKIVMLETADAVGPAASLEFDAIVVTCETATGAGVVNAAREALGHDPVQVVVVDLLGQLDVSHKLSSTGIRNHLCSQLEAGETDLIWLRDQWLALQEQLGVSEAASQEWWSTLRDLYGLQPWRAYHTLRHVLELLKIAEREYDQASPKELRLAVWFHDAIYRPRSGTNEADSDELFRDYIYQANPACCQGQTVSTAIMMTRNHVDNIQSADDIDPWIRPFLEMDLAILGTPASRYEEYSRQIRYEYGYFPNAVFDSKRLGFLESIRTFRFKLLREHARLNQCFKRNLAWEIRNLG